MSEQEKDFFQVYAEESWKSEKDLWDTIKSGAPKEQLSGPRLYQAHISPHLNPAFGPDNLTKCNGNGLVEFLNDLYRCSKCGQLLENEGDFYISF